MELLKEIADLLDKFPQLALWILTGLLFYKVVIIGSYFGILRLLILKGHDYLRSPKEVIQKIKITDHCYSHDGADAELLRFLERYNKFKGGHNLAISDVQYIEKIFWQKLNECGVKKHWQIDSKCFEEK